MRKASLIMMLLGALIFGMTSCSGDAKHDETEHHDGDHNHEGEAGHDHQDGEDTHHEGDHAH